LIVANALDAARVGQRPVTRHDSLRVERQNRFAGGDPVADRSGPDDRMAVDEQDVAREDGAVGRHPDNGVAAGMGGSDFDQLDCFVADAPGQAPTESRVGKLVRGVREIEAPEAVPRLRVNNFQERNPFRILTDETPAACSARAA